MQQCLGSLDSSLTSLNLFFPATSSSIISNIQNFIIKWTNRVARYTLDNKTCIKMAYLSLDDEADCEMADMLKYSVFLPEGLGWTFTYNPVTINRWINK